MKYIKLFESTTEIEIAKICEQYGIKNWSINKDGLVDVDGSVRLNYRNLTKLPLRFGIVTGDFYCRDNKLTTLEGAPKEVGGGFFCYNNNLTTLEGGPKEVGGAFYCDHNKLTTLEGAPQEVGGSFICRCNNLTTLEGAPQEVGGSFLCYYNNLATLKWAPEYIDGKVDFLPNSNLPIEFLNFLRLNDYKPEIQTYILKWQKDYAIWRKDGSFNKANFIRMMEDAQDELKIKIKFPK